jgi:hypothetical protein
MIFWDAEEVGSSSLLIESSTKIAHMHKCAQMHHKAHHKWARVHQKWARAHLYWKVHRLLKLIRKANLRSPNLTKRLNYDFFEISKVFRFFILPINMHLSLEEDTLLAESKFIQNLIGGLKSWKEDHG